MQPLNTRKSLRSSLLKQSLRVASRLSSEMHTGSTTVSSSASRPFPRQSARRQTVWSDDAVQRLALHAAAADVQTFFLPCRPVLQTVHSLALPANAALQANARYKLQYRRVWVSFIIYTALLRHF